MAYYHHNQWDDVKLYDYMYFYVQAHNSMQQDRLDRFSIMGAPKDKNGREIVINRITLYGTREN